MSQRPNILFLMSDQQRYDTLGVLNTSIKTPNLDRLAEKGTVFTRAYPPTPVCLPCRGSLLSGLYPSSSGAMHNYNALDLETSPTVAGALAEQGYYTHMIGKSHVHPCHVQGSPEAAPHIHDRDYFRSWHGPWYGFEHADINVGHSTEKHGCSMHYGVWLEERGIDTDKYFGHTDYEAYGTWDLPEDAHNSKWVADTVIDAMSSAKDAGKPFYISANFQDPHNPCYVPEPWASMYDPKDLPIHGFKPGEPECFEDKPPFYQEIIRSAGPYGAVYSDSEMAPNNACHLDWDQGKTQENVAKYYGMVSLMDHHIGRIIDELEARGLWEHTIVVFTSDHGDFLGDHGLWWKELYPYEEAIRVPMIVSALGIVPEGKQSAALQGLIDLAPTWLSLAGLQAPQEFQGVDQSQCWRAGEQVRDTIVVEDRPGPGAFNQRIVITDTHKLVAYANPAYGELYNIQKDPNQIVNLWSDPHYADLRFELMQRLLTHEMNRHAPNVPTYGDEFR